MSYANQIDRFESFVDRARRIMVMGRESQQFAFDVLVESGVEPDIAFFAVKGAVLLEKERQ